MHKHVALLMVMWSLALPAAAADELTDAMLGVDPRDQYDTGTGRVYDQAYGPPETPAEESLDTAADLSGYSASLGSAYQGLRSSLYDTEIRSEPEEPKLLSPDSPDTAPDAY